MDFVVQNVFWIVLAAVSGGMLVGPMLRGGGRNAVSPTDAITLINRKDAIILDVREPNEFEAGHLPNARNIPAATLTTRTEELAKFKSRPIVVICQSGARSDSAVGVLKKAGFEQAFNVAGGIKAWKDAGHPVTRDK